MNFFPFFQSAEVLDTVSKDVKEVANLARTKSVEAYDYVKKDLEELTATVQEEVSSTATALKQKLKVTKFGNCKQLDPVRPGSWNPSSNSMKLISFVQIEETGGTAASVKRSLTSFLNQVSDAFYIPPEDDDEPIFLDRLQATVSLFGASSSSPRMGNPRKCELKSDET